MRWTDFQHIQRRGGGRPARGALDALEGVWGNQRSADVQRALPLAQRTHLTNLFFTEA